MKKALVVLGVGFAGLLLLVAVMFGAGYGLLLLHETEAKTYVDDVVRRLATHWDESDLIAEASPEMLQAASAPQMRRLLQTFGARLGALRGYDGATRDGYVVNFTMAGRVLTITHTAAAVFERGPATIKIRTIRRDGHWKILDFYVVSDALLDQPREGARSTTRL